MSDEYNAGYEDAEEALRQKRKTQYGVQVVWADPVGAGAVKKGEKYIPTWQEFDSEDQADAFVSFYRFPAPDGTMFTRAEVAEINRSTRWAIELYGEWEA